MFIISYSESHCHSYCLTGVVPPSPSKPEVKTNIQIETLWNACKLARHVLDKVAKSIQVLKFGMLYSVWCYHMFSSFI